MAKALIFVCLAIAASAANARLLLQAGATQELPQFLLPPVPPQATAQVSALLASIGGNVNAFADALTSANSVGGETAVARAFADAISAGNATTLLNAIATATAFGRSNVSNIADAAYGRAVADQIGRGNVNVSSDALAGAFTLAGGSGPALATVRQLSDIVQSVGCTGPLAETLKNSTNLVIGNNCPYSGRAQTFAYTIAQEPGVSGCWTTVGGNVAGNLLSSIQPVFVVPASPSGVNTVPAGSANPTSTALPAPGASGAEVPAGSSPQANGVGGQLVATPGQEMAVAPTAAALAPGMATGTQGTATGGGAGATAGSGR